MEELLVQAIEKLETEKKTYNIKGKLAEWIDEIINEFDTTPELIEAVCKKDKTAAGYIALTADYGFENAVTVDKKIVDMCPKIKKVIGNHDFKIGFPEKARRKKLIREYYLGEKS